MSPEEAAQLRYLMRRSQELPQPMSQLFQRASKRMSAARPSMPSITSQAATEVKAEETHKKKLDEAARQTQRLELKENFKKQEIKQNLWEIEALGKLKDRVTDPNQRREAIARFKRISKEAKKERQAELKEMLKKLKKSKAE